MVSVSDFRSAKAWARMVSIGQIHLWILREYLKEMHKESRGLRGREFLLLLSVQKLLRWMASC